MNISGFSNSINQAALFIANKIAYNKKLGYSTGENGLNYWQFASSLGIQLKKIKRQIEHEKFSFTPFKKIIRRLKLSKTRDIYIANWCDKIVERWLLENIGMKLHKVFSPNSYAYRFGDVGLDSCIINIKNNLNENSFIIKRDFRNYFPTINHEILLNKLGNFIDPNSYLFKLLKQRVLFEYKEEDKIFTANIGIPFGSTLACLFANIYLHDLDCEIDKVGVHYFRYADDILVITNDESKYNTVKKILDDRVVDLKLTFKESATINNRISSSFTKFNHLGFELSAKNFRLAVEKQRKIINFFEKVLKFNRSKINKIGDIDEKLKFIVNVCNEVFSNRIRSSAIIDYYLHHITDDNQLALIDKLIIQKIICSITGVTFKNKHYKIVSAKKLRELGLISILHRSRLIRHGHIRVNFLSLFNKLNIQKYEQAQDAYLTKINKIKLFHKVKKIDINSKIQ